MTWFDRVREEFSGLAMPFAGRPIGYLEYGCWKGDSAAWVCENILTHRDCEMYVVDPYEADAKHSREEVQAIMLAAHERILQYRSCVFLSDRRQIQETVGDVHLCYIDGAHDAASVVLDFCAAWPHLSQIAVVVFDDWSIGKRKTIRHVPEAVEALALAFGDMIDWFHRGPRLSAFRILSKQPPDDEAMLRYLKGRQE